MALGHQVEKWRRPLFNEECKVKSEEFPGADKLSPGDKVAGRPSFASGYGGRAKWTR